MEPRAQEPSPREPVDPVPAEPLDQVPLEYFRPIHKKPKPINVRPWFRWFGRCYSVTLFLFAGFLLLGGASGPDLLGVVFLLFVSVITMIQTFRS
jgi:hypothetical protein